MRISGIIGLVLLLGVLSGCATMARTAEENQANFNQILAIDARMLADDLNLIAQTERSLRLTRWQTR